MRSFKILIGGDIFPCRINEKLFCEGNIQELYGEKILSLFKSADYSIVNLEGVLSDTSEKQIKIGPIVKWPQENINGIKNLGVTSVALANNHITDANNIGCKDTISLLEKYGIQWVGAGTTENMKEYLSFNLGDTRICIYNVSELFWNTPSPTTIGANIYDEYAVCKTLHRLKQEHDLVIVIYHGGAERFHYSTPATRRHCHRMADSGADVILTQHTHCIGCEEYYNGSYILYGQGNFIFRNSRKDFEVEPTLHGLLIEVDVQDKKYSIIKHAISIDRQNFTASYDKVQDFTEFNRRSEKNKDVNWVNEEFKLNKEWKVIEYLYSLKSNSFFWKYLKRYCPSLSKKLLLKTFSYKKLLLLKYLMFGSRPNETMYEALDTLLMKKNMG